MRKYLYLFLQSSSYVCAIAIVIFSTNSSAQTKNNTSLPAPLEEITLEETKPKITTRSVKFNQMGRDKGMQLTGVITTGRMNSGVRLDELIVKAELELKMLYPPGLEFRTAYLRVLVNDQLAGLYPLEEEKAGAYHFVNIPLATDFFTDFADIKLEFLALPITTNEQPCTSPTNPSLRLDIAPDSKLIIHSLPLPLVDDLALLPVPFFDPRDSKQLKLPFILPAEQDTSILKAAGVVASWFGAQASYRQASFKIEEQIPSDRHSIVFSLGDQLPKGMSKEDITGPMLVIDSLTENKAIKQLFFIGRNSDELNQAVLAFVLEDDSLSGKHALVEDLSIPPLRKPYDAPQYVPTDRPVYFYELIDYPTQLEASTSNPDTLINLRLPPDLFNWSGSNIDMNLKYRYTAPSEWNDSILSIDINGNLIESLRLAPIDEQRESLFNLGLFERLDGSQEEILKIPAFRVSGNNQMRFTFDISDEGYSDCSGQPSPARASIDPESKIDFSSLPHYIKMPDLAAFANSGYPFSIHADLSQTAIVLPNNLNHVDQSEFLNLMGLFGQWTGIASKRVNILSPEELANHPKGLHWITFGDIKNLTWLEQYQLDLPMILKSKKRSLGNAPIMKSTPLFWHMNKDESPIKNQGQALIETDGSLGAIMGFESPFASKKTGVVITGTTQASYQRAMSALADYGEVAKIRGSVALIRGKTLQSYKTGDTFVMGDLPWYLKIRILLAQYPLLVTVIGVLAGFGLAVLIFGWLAKGNRRRKKGE